MRRAVFIVDMREESGKGHLKRCVALADELREHEWDTFVFDSISDRVPVAPDVIVVDSYTMTPDDIAALGAGSPMSPIVVISDRAEFRLDCDLVVNGTVLGARQQYDTPGRVLAGPEYALLRRDFRDARQQTRMRRFECLDVRSLTGLSARRLATYMRDAEIAITNGGMRSLELACAGTPSVVVALNDYEEANAHGLHDAGAALCPRAAGLRSTPVREIAALLTETSREQMRAAAERLVDGRGCARVREAIERLAAGRSA